MPIPLSHIIAFACLNIVSDLLVWLIPFIYNPSNYVPQIDSPVPDQPNNGLMTYVPHPLITLPVPPQPTSLVPSGYYDIQPASPIPLDYFGSMMELSTTLEPSCGPTAYLDRVYSAIKRTDLLCPVGSPFPECLFGGNGGFRKSLVEFHWKANGLLCDYMCRRIFAYLLNSPTLNRQVAFWDKMKRFFRDILPRPLSDLLFQNSLPLRTVDVSTQTEPQGIDACTQTEPQGVDVYTQAEPIVQITDTSTQTELPSLLFSNLPPVSHPPILWPQRAMSILRPRTSISTEIRDRSRVFQLPEESCFLSE